MVLKKGKNTFITTDPVQIAAFKKSGYTEVKSRGAQQAKQENQENAVPETEENIPETEDAGDVT